MSEQILYITMLHISSISMCNCGSNEPCQCKCAHRHHDFPERGWIQFLILRLLYDKPMHGYHLREELEQRGYVISGRLESGSVYTILRRMEHKGFLTSEWERVEGGPDKRIYRLTDEGLETLRAGLDEIVRRKAMMDDLVSFYTSSLKKET